MRPALSAWPLQAAPRAWLVWLLRALAVAGLLVALGVFATPASAHAYPLKLDPAPRAVLRVTPSHVVIVFSERVNPSAAQIRVTDAANQREDLGDTEISGSDAHTVSVSVQLLGAGNYIVLWRAQSADDGHVSAGSYYFQVARPDGSVPSPPTQLPGQPNATDMTLDGPTWLQAIATWIALLCLTLWVGAQIWETWVLNPRLERDPDLRNVAERARDRFRALSTPLLAILIVVNVVIVLTQAAQLAGGWDGVVSPPLLRAVLIGGRSGQLWWARQLVTLLALYLPLLARRLQQPDKGQAAIADERVAVARLETPDWRRELLSTLRRVRELPRRLAAGWRARTIIERLSLVLAGALLVLYAFSGHAAAVTADRFWLAVSVDLLHLLAEAAWLGGLFYIAVILLPALRQMTEQLRARVLALGLPQFGALAITCAAALAITGSLNTTIRLSSAAQLVTTAYGRTLVIKILLFLLMAAISAYHAFVLRPRLATRLQATPAPMEARATADVALVQTETRERVGVESPPPDTRDDPGHGPSEPPPTISFWAERIADWLRREAILGGGVLFCVTLLAALAGTLASAPQPVNPGTSGPFTQTQQAGPYAVTLTVAPAAFGANTVTVTLKDDKGQPATGVAVLVDISHTEMDMGTASVQLKPVGDTAPGSYQRQADLVMPGRWQFVVKLLPPGGPDFVMTTFIVPVSY